jgi:hypothetical protein
MSGMSSTEGKIQTFVWINNHDIKSILDVGAGSGTYYDLLHNNGFDTSKMDALEVWLPYVGDYDLPSKYKSVFIEDARTWQNWKYDLVILGDVLEHMTKDEALAVWDKVAAEAKHAIISIPIIHYPQGHLAGNPYEEHVKDDWTVEEVLESFKGIAHHEVYPTVGVFYANF